MGDLRKKSILLAVFVGGGWGRKQLGENIPLMPFNAGK